MTSAMESRCVSRTWSRATAPRDSEVTALAGVSVEVRRGERVAFLGKSGSGKSTLLNLIGGLDRPSSGRDRGWWQRPRKDDRQRVGLAPADDRRDDLPGVQPDQFADGPGKRRAADDPGGARQGWPADRGERGSKRSASDSGSGIGPYELSGGEHQRVAIAQALVNRPEILLADEPTGNLDSATAGEIVALLLDEVGEGTTLIMVTHDEELGAELGRSDRVSQGRTGRLMTGKPADQKPPERPTSWGYHSRRYGSKRFVPSSRSPAW